MLLGRNAHSKHPSHSPGKHLFMQVADSLQPDRQLEAEKGLGHWVPLLLDPGSSLDL